MRVVGPAGEQLGVLTIEAALEKAQEFGMDLVEVNPMAKPPVCKIMDYGRFKYEEKKRASEAKKKQVVVHLKEVKMRPKTEEHDYEFKVRNVKRFLEEGNKARITIMFRGREITHKELGQSLLEDVIKDVKEVGVVEQVPRMEGRQMFMILAPNPKVAQRARDLARQRAAGQQESKPEPAPAAAAQASKAPAGPGRHFSRRALQAALLINLYRDEPILHAPFRLLAILADVERNFTTWRQRHAQMAMRMIGTRIGTGGSSGAEYLERAAERHRVFTDLSALASFYIPRSALPKLPPEVRSRMGFRFGTP